VFSDPKWEGIQRALIESQLVSAESKNTSGKPKLFLRRLVTQQEMLSGLDPDADAVPSVKRFWTLLEERFSDPQ
jgi:hypothetical protein